jgi:hypothetical protein
LILLRKYLKSLAFPDAPFGLNPIRVKALVRDNPDEQAIGAAIEAVSLVKDWLHRGTAERSAMLPKNNTTFADDKVVVAENLLFFVY